MTKKRVLALVVGLLLCHGYVVAESYALIMAVGDYQRSGISTLKGTKFDVGSAIQIAKRLGVPQQNISTYAEGQITRLNVLRYFDQLAEKMQDGDQAFIYFSGHGSRSLIVETDKKDLPRRCAEALVAVDGEMIYDYDIEDAIKKVATKAHRVFVMFDACHSGGVSKRNVRAGDFTPKFSAANDFNAANAACAKPVNVLTRGVNQASSMLGKGGNNVVIIAASRENEVAFDLPSGGVATTNIKQCLFSDSADFDRSGAVSWEELRECAQALINKQISGAYNLPHHITLHGNVKAIAKFDPPLSVSTSSPMLPGNGPTSLPGTTASTQLPLPPTVFPVAQPAAFTPLKPPVVSAPPSFKTLEDLYQQRDDRRTVKLQLKADKFRIDKDALEFSVESQRDGYLYVLAAGSDGKTIDILFPNKVDRDNYIRANVQSALPRTDWQIVAGGPPGKNRLLVIVADSERDFSSLPLMPSGPFSSVGANLGNQASLQAAMAASSAGRTNCLSQDGKRNFIVAKDCSNRFAAAMTDLEEIK